jgi:hypothetical protein
MMEPVSLPERRALLTTRLYQASAAAAAPKGLAASRHANGTREDDTETAGKDEPAAEGEREPDHSSAALALVRAPLA